MKDRQEVAAAAAAKKKTKKKTPFHPLPAHLVFAGEGAFLEGDFLLELLDLVRHHLELALALGHLVLRLEQALAQRVAFATNLLVQRLLRGKAALGVGDAALRVGQLRLGHLRLLHGLDALGRRLLRLGRLRVALFLHARHGLPQLGRLALERRNLALEVALRRLVHLRPPGQTAAGHGVAGGTGRVSTNRSPGPATRRVGETKKKQKLASRP